MFKTFNVLIIVIFIIIICLIYKNYEKNNNFNKETILLNEYFLNENVNMTNVNKPILFVHIDYEYNSRNWVSFGSRSSCELNIPFLYFTLKSIIQHCNSSFHICIINDSSFKKIIPNWNINLNEVAEPMKSYIRQLGIIKLLNIYGGINVPISFLCFKNLIDLYENNINNISQVFVCETLDKNITSTYHDFYPNINFIGSVKENQCLKELIQFMEINISQDMTYQPQFLGVFDRWLNDKVENNEIKLVDGSFIGVKNINGNKILIDNLMNDEYLNLSDDTYGLYIPLKELLIRRKYEYYLRMNKIQILKSNCILSKYILTANIPNQNEEGYDNIINNDVETSRTKYGIVGWWATNLKPPLWGVRPLMVAPKDNVIQLKHPL